MADLYFAVIQAINRTPLRTLPAPDFKILVSETSPGVRLILQVDEADVCTVVPKERVVSLVAQYVQSKLLDRPDYAWEHRHILECVRLWLVSTPLTPWPKATRFRSEKGLCFYRLPFDLVPDPEGKRTPLWDELFSRMTNSRAVKVWIGSLFVEASNRQQYVYLYGEGRDSKGALARFLQRALASSAASQSALPRLSNKHWAIPYEGKRLIVYSDFEDYEKLSSGLLRSLTGGDAVFVDRKGKDGYTTELSCKLLFCSNNMPSISSLKADLRRIIFAQLRSIDVPEDYEYEDKLWAEGGAFLWHCVTAYSEECPRHGPIPSSVETQDEMRDWGSSYDEEYEIFLNDHFQVLLSKDEMRDDARVRATADLSVSAKLVLYWLEEKWPRNRKAQMGFRHWLKQRYGISSRCVRGGPAVGKKYLGLKMQRLSIETTYGLPPQK